MNYNELQKLYPEFRIPYNPEAEYYIDLLRLTDKSLENKFNNFAALELFESDPVKYKHKKFDEILAYFKEKGWELNLIEPLHALYQKFPADGYTEKDFNNYKPNKFYVSIDLREANWQAFKTVFELPLPNFEEFTGNQFKLHRAIAQSKSFRQFLFGNTNPKRLQQVQKGMMLKLYNLLPEDLKALVVGKKSDELLLESDSPIDFDNRGYPMLVANGNEIEYKVSYFGVEEHTNFGEFVRIKKEFISSDQFFSKGRKLMGVPGNRFFLHYKTLILDMELEERDLYFMNDKHLAKWLLF